MFYVVCLVVGGRARKDEGTQISNSKEKKYNKSPLWLQAIINHQTPRTEFSSSSEGSKTPRTEFSSSSEGSKTPRTEFSSSSEGSKTSRTEFSSSSEGSKTSRTEYSCTLIVQRDRKHLE